MKRSLRFSPFAIGVVALSLLSLLAADLLMLRENKRLKDAIDTRTASLAPQSGTVLPPLRGFTGAGEDLEITYGDIDSETLVFVFSTTCSLCDANWPYWESIAKQVDPDRYRLVYANTSESLSGDYMQDHFFEPTATLLARVDPESIVDYSLSLTPMILLIGPDGIINTVWLGVTREEKRLDMEATLEVSLADVELAG